MSVLQTFMRRWYEPSVLPIVGVIGVAFAGCGYYITRLLTHPEVVYSRRNELPWTNMSPTDEPRKFLLINKQKYEEVAKNRPSTSY